MSGYPPFDGLAATAAALVVILSAIISVIAAGARWRAVDLGQARAQDLCELTGILSPEILQDTFGPPDMGRVWRQVTRADVKAARRPLGHLMSNEIFDYVCLGIAVASFLINHPLMNLALLAAFAAQVASWVFATQVPK
ncbi:MAG: hypothetical protein MRY64_15170 [Hyphomonadaceae bacterium]|nr:hypothetical protein [Hyphomonadaceae bacterium]